ncbi:DNA (cytosine-5-)-methyltransferase [Enterococcus hirae]|nr:DNA (cytosine-5-)-methyltransferase [Enterococcus hirae]
MTMRVIETFSGIGSQAKALKNLSKRNADFKYKIVATVEWEIGAMYAYDLIHHGPQDTSRYDDLSKDELIKMIEKFNISSDGKQPIKRSTIVRMPIEQLKAILTSIDNNNNYVDISTVRAADLPDADLLTYSFPCQDLSVSSYWHGNFSGIQKGVKNRSGLLWEIERILNEYENDGKMLPRFLLMENVSAIHSLLHEKNFKLWRKELERLGYSNRYYDLDASDFGIPQSRLRTFMISIFTGDLDERQVNEISHFFEETKLKAVNENPTIADFLRLDYSNPVYLKEAFLSTPNNTSSREKIRDDSVVLATGSSPSLNIAKTITTKQDRNPNAGIIIHNRDWGKAEYRNLTPRETFLLMGFDESDFQSLIDNNLRISKSRCMLSHAKLLKLSGNSIVVNILEEIFSELSIVEKRIINNKKVVSFKPLAI